MKKLLAVLSFTIALAVAQLTYAAAAQAASGSVTFTPPAPGRLVAVAGSVTCTLTGNAVPATGVSVSCIVGSVTIPVYNMPLTANQAYTFDQRFNGDDVTVILSADANGKITYQAAATPNGGQTVSGTGSF